MKFRTLITTLLIAGSAFAQGSLRPLPDKWTGAGLDKAGSQCSAGVDAALQAEGQGNLTIACSADATPVVRQAFQAEPFWGKSVKFSGWVRTRGYGSDGPNGTGGAGLFIETGKSRKVSIVPIVRIGGPEWEYREVIVEVPRGDTNLSVGLWLGARGQVWARDFKFEALDAATSAISTKPVVVTKPLAPMPAGWGLQDGSKDFPGNCEVGVDSEASANGSQVFSVRCTNNQPSFGGARQMFSSANYRGKRVRVSGWLKASNVEGKAGSKQAAIEGAAGLWLGVGSQSGGIRMDRMENRAIKGSTDWVYREFVADVPDDSVRSFVGFWMQGKGQIWARDLTVEVVAKTVPLSPIQDIPQTAPGAGLTLK